jgi:hypothetical protein
VAFPVVSTVCSCHQTQDQQLKCPSVTVQFQRRLRTAQHVSRRTESFACSQSIERAGSSNDENEVERLCSVDEDICIFPMSILVGKLELWAYPMIRLGRLSAIVTDLVVLRWPRAYSSHIEAHGNSAAVIIAQGTNACKPAILFAIGRVLATFLHTNSSEQSKRF